MEHINLEFFTNLEKEGKMSVIDFCIKMGFLASSYECSECLKPMKLYCHKDRGQDRFVWCCSSHRQHVKRSVRSGSWFQESRLSLIKMLKLAYLWVKRTPYAWIVDELQLSKNTVCDWMAFFRRVCVNTIQTEGIFIGGPDKIVEIDAKNFCTKNKQGREIWVFGGVERSTMKCFLEIIQSGEEDEIISILQKYVHPGTTIVSDSWKGFECLESNGYVHQKTSGIKNSVTGAHKNNILCVWSKLKKIVSQKIGKGHFDSHLAEFMWRHLHQEDTQGLLRSFFKILSQMCTPQVKDDPAYVSRRVKMEEETGDCIKRESASDKELSEKDFIREIKVPLKFPGDSINGVTDEFGESQNKRQKTMENVDT